MNFNQCVGRAFYRAGVAERAQEAAHQRGLAGAKVAFKPDHEARTRRLRQGSAERERGGLVGEV